MDEKTRTELKAAEERAISMSYENAHELVYGIPYPES